jgi:hypothetical protein
MSSAFRMARSRASIFRIQINPLIHCIAEGALDQIALAVCDGIEGRPVSAVWHW